MNILILFHHQSKIYVRSGEMAQLLRLNAALMEDHNAVPSTYIRQLIADSNSSSR